MAIRHRFDMLMCLLAVCDCSVTAVGKQSSQDVESGLHGRMCFLCEARFICVAEAYI